VQDAAAWEQAPAQAAVRDHLAELGAHATEVEGVLGRARIGLCPDPTAEPLRHHDAYVAYRQAVNETILV